MATRDNPPPPATHTTNDEDQRQVSELRLRLQQQTGRRRRSSDNQQTGNHRRLPSVEIAEGAHKYVLIQATWMGNDENGDEEEQYFVTSRKNANYHRDSAEPMIEQLEQAAGSYSDIAITGGGRIALNTPAKTIAIFGFSYGFGLADHAMARRVVLEDDRYHDFDVTISDEGY